jgi:hypothetical protein
MNKESNLATFKQKRIRKIIRFIDHFGIPLDCECGKKHNIKISDFNDENGILRPRENIKLSCVHYYNQLSDIQDIKLDIKAEFEGGYFRNFIGNAYIGIWKIWLNW